MNNQTHNTNEMKATKFLAIAMAAIMAVAACQKKEPVTPNPDQELKLKVSASLYQFTKATDTAFEDNDAIGLYMFNPETYAENVKYTMNGGALTTAEDIVWYDDAELEATITAYYPYNESADGTFTVNADQSTAANYTASDLMFAVTASKPTAEVVKLPFKHALSKIVVTIDNQLNEEIAEVYFADVLGQVTFDINNTSATATGEAGTVKALKSGENTWQLIVAPQTASPKLAITTASEKQFTFVLDEDVTFSAGKMSTATVTVSRESIYTSFTPEIEDWTADNELNFSQNDDEEVVLPEEPEVDVTEARAIYLKPNANWISDNARFAVYSWVDNENNTWTDMTDLDGDGIYKVIIPDGHVNFIFCRMKPDQTTNNWDNKWSQSVDNTFPPEGNCFEMSAEAWDKDSTEFPWAGTWKTIEANK